MSNFPLVSAVTDSLRQTVWLCSGVDEERSHKQHSKRCPGSSNIQRRLGSSQVRGGPVVTYKNDTTISTTNLQPQFRLHCTFSQAMSTEVNGCCNSADKQLLTTLEQFIVNLGSWPQVWGVIVGENTYWRPIFSSWPPWGRSVTVNRYLRVQQKKVLFPHTFHSQTFLDTLVAPAIFPQHPLLSSLAQAPRISYHSFGNMCLSTHTYTVHSSHGITELWPGPYTCAWCSYSRLWELQGNKGR